MKLYTTVKDGMFFRPLSGLKIDLTSTSKEKPKEIEDSLAIKFVNNRNIFEAKEDIAPVGGTAKEIEVMEKTEEEKPVIENFSQYDDIQRNIIYKQAKTKGWNKPYCVSKKEDLIIFMKGVKEWKEYGY